MSLRFTVHCLPWKAGAPLIRELRAACKLLDGISDEIDFQSYHAIALSGHGIPVGHARLTPAGEIDRIMIPARDDSPQIESALREILQRYREQSRSAA